MTTFVDLATGEVIDVVEGRDAGAVASWLAAQPWWWRRRVEVVAIDPSASFRSAVRRWLPKPRVAVDHFHLVKLAGDMLHHLLLLRGYNTMSERGRAKLEHVLRTDDPTNESGKRLGLWKGLAETFPRAAEHADIADLRDRLLVIEALETAKCFEEGVIESAAAANIGSIMGIGFPPATGGAAQYITGFDGPTGRGLKGFVARANQLADAYGERFRPTAALVEMAESGGAFPA